MSHFLRERSDADWYRGLKVPEAVIRNIDEKTRKAVSGTGGTYAPSSPVVLGGAGLELHADVQLVNGTTAKAAPGAGKNFRFGDDDYFQYETGAPRARAYVDSPLLLLAKESLQREARPWGSITTVPTLRTKRPYAHLLCPLRIPDGGRLAALEIGFMVGQTHASVPEMPKARAVRISPDGTYEQHPHPASSSYDPDGWVRPAVPASGALWYAGGALQTLTLSYAYAVMDPADTSRYAYGVEWYDEAGTNAFADDVGTHLVYFKSTVYLADMRPY